MQSPDHSAKESVHIDGGADDRIDGMHHIHVVFGIFYDGNPSEHKVFEDIVSYFILLFGYWPHPDANADDDALCLVSIAILDRIRPFAQEKRVSSQSTEPDES